VNKAETDDGATVRREKWAAIIARWDRRFSKGVESVCVFLLAAIVITVMASIVTRFAIFHPLNFADALAKYLMMWMAFLGVSLALRKGEHIAVEALKAHLTGRTRLLLELVIAGGMAAFLALVVYFGALNAWSGRNSHDPFVFGVSMMIPYLSVPAGALCALAQLLLTTALRWARAAAPTGN